MEEIIIKFGKVIVKFTDGDLEILNGVVSWDDCSEDQNIIDTQQAWDKCNHFSLINN